jgi:1-acyl-sn-glycerol-3-phosphate acyltransferase
MGQYNARMKVPELGPQVPNRGNAFSRWLGRGAFSLSRWRFIGALPNLPKFVVIVAPHTSNWDFFVGVGALFSLGIRVSFLGKDSIFRGPPGAILRWLGGIPVDRSVSRDRVAEMVGVFQGRDRLVVGLTPEGTRKLVSQWKTGFYHVARGASVPIVPVAFDYGRKAVVIGEPFYPSGNLDSDMAQLHAFYSGVTAKRPENFGG